MIKVPWFERIFWQRLLIAAVIFAGFGIRIFDLKDPPLDFHATRQLRSAILSRAYYYQLDESADQLLRDKAVSMGQALEMYEPPILEGIVAGIYLIAGQEIWWVSRILNAIFWCVGGLALFQIARRYSGFYASLTGLAFYLSLPFSVIASRSFQPDPWMVMWLLLAIQALLRWMDTNNWKTALLAGLVAGVAILVKLFTVFPQILIWVGVILSRNDWRARLKDPRLYVAVIPAALPSLLFYIFNLGQRSSDFFSFWTLGLSHLILESNFYADWLSMLHSLFGLTNILLSVVGISVAKRELRAVLVGGWVGYFIYGLFFPYQMLTHEYYHLMTIALIGLSIVPIAQAVYIQLHIQHWFWRLTAIGGLLFAAGYCLYVSRSVLVASDYSNEPLAWQKIGDAIPPDGKLIALTSEYGNRLMYYGWRGIAGYWPNSADLRLFTLAGSGPMEFDSYFSEKTAGMDFFLVTMFSEFDAQPELKEMLNNYYPVLSEGDGYILYDLRHSRTP